MPYQYAKYIMQNDFNSMDAGCNEVVLWISLKKQLTYYQLKCQHFTNTMYSYMIVTYVECGFFFLLSLPNIKHGKFEFVLTNEQLLYHCVLLHLYQWIESGT